LPHVEVIDTQAVDPVSLISYEKVIMSVQAAKKLEVELG
jgi:large subunit ribosomal protein L4